LVAEYERLSDHTFWPAGVAYTQPEIGYQTVNLGFGVEFMMDELLPNGYYATGIDDRADLMANIMAYFGKGPTGPPTEAPESPALVTRLGRVYPNPFNPVTTIEYGMAERGRVVVRVYDPAGRLVRTLLDAERRPGEHKATWDGTTDEGPRAASGVYFIRMEAGGFEAVDKLVLLK
jgi:hypothetical protein